MRYLKNKEVTINLWSAALQPVLFRMQKQRQQQQQNKKQKNLKTFIKMQGNSENYIICDSNVSSF